MKIVIPYTIFQTKELMLMVENKFKKHMSNIMFMIFKC